MKKEISFEEKMDELNQILEKLQSPDTHLEESVQLYKTAAELIASCKKILEAAELQVEEITGSITDVPPEDKA